MSVDADPAGVRATSSAFEPALSRGRVSVTYNVVAERSVSIRQLAEAIVAIVPTTISFGPPRPGDVPSARVSSALAARELGWSARVPFEEGLAEIVEEARAVAARS